MKILATLFMLFIKIGTVGLITASLLAYLGDIYYGLDLLSHFKWLYWVFSFLLVGIFLVCKRFVWLILAVIPLVVNSIEVIPWYLKDDQFNVSKNTDSTRLFFANVLTINEQHHRLLRLIDSQSPDLIVLQETDTRWIKALQPLKKQYPYTIEVARSDNFGIAVYSRHPFIQSRVIYDISPSNLPSTFFSIKLGKRLVSFMATHPLPPIGRSFTDSRNQQLTNVGRFMNNLSGSRVLIGDLNTTMWSGIYKALAETTELANTRQGFGVLPTWPSQVPLLQIPIDHVLVSSDISVDNMFVGSDIGSDHLPIIVDIGFFD